MTNVNLKDLTKRINSIKTRSKTLRNDIQSAGIDCVSVLFEDERNGDTVFITKLANSMGKGANCSSFVRWIEAFTPAFKKPAKDGTKDTFTIDGSEYVFGLEKGWKDLDKSEVLAQLGTMQWYDMPKPVSEEAPFDVLKAIEGIIKKADKASVVENIAYVKNLEALLKANA